MSRGRAWRLAVLVGLAAWLHPDGRLWLLGPLVLVGLGLAVAAWRGGRQAPLLLAGAGVLALGVWGFLDARSVAGVEREIRALYATGPAPPFPPALLLGRADGPTGPVTATVRPGETGIQVAFAHREPPWVGGPALAALAARMADEPRLPRPDAARLRAPVECAGLRAVEDALTRGAGRSAEGLPISPARLLRAEQDTPAVMVVPALLLLVLALETALAAAVGRAAGSPA